MQRLLPPKLVLILLLVTVPLGILAPVLGPAPFLWRLAGLVMLLGGLGLTAAGSSLFSRIGTNIVTFDDPGVLVTSGPFARTRNPMYLGLTLILVGTAMLVGSLTVWLGPVGFWLAADRWYIPFEEARMSATFGRDYEDYCARVPRWLGPVGRVRERTS